MRSTIGFSRRFLLGASAALVGPPTMGSSMPGSSARADAPQDRLTVFAAASLTDALTQIGALWQAQGRTAPRFSFASSGALARQIDQGAAADLFLSADETWMDWLAKRDRLRAATRTDLVGNRLVLVERRDALKPLALAPGADLAGLLGAAGRLAVGDPSSVPAGIYAKQALTALGLWNAVQNRLAPAENVRGALLLVQRGEAPAGIVYASDVRVTHDLAVAGVFPASSHPPIVYPGAVLKQAPMPQQAQELLAFLAGGAAQAVFHNLGFSRPGGARPANVTPDAP